MNVMCLIVNFCKCFVSILCIIEFILIFWFQTDRYDFLRSTLLCSVQVIFIHRFNLFKKVTKCHHFQRIEPIFCNVKKFYFSLEAQEVRAKCHKVELPHVRKSFYLAKFFRDERWRHFLFPNICGELLFLNICRE